ncbi:MAG: hypothetical protein JW938_06765 [Candidatus Omnitrophica bacterium]|nr:hypothetical protein [Candidatus Omnitrophota bacterium]
MKIVSGLIGLVVLAIVTFVAVNLFCNVNYNTETYDILIYSKAETPKRHVGIRYKNDFMVHVFEKKTVGDSVGSLIDEWQQRQAEKS